MEVGFSGQENYSTLINGENSDSLNLSDALRVLIESYLKNDTHSPKKTVKQLAQRASVSHKTIERILKGETQTEPYIAFQIVSYLIKDKEKLQDFYNSYLFDLLPHMRPFLAKNDFRVPQKIGDLLEKAAHDIDYFKVYSVFLLKEGRSKDFISNQFGLRGLQVLSEMIEDGFVQEAEEGSGLYVLCENEIAYSNPFQIKAYNKWTALLCQQSLQSYNPSTFGNGRSFIFNSSLNLTEDGLNLLRAKIIELVNEELPKISLKHAGKETVAIGLCLSPLLTKSEENRINHDDI